MTFFLWTIVVILLLDISAKTVILYGGIKERSLWAVAFDLVANVVLVGWALYLLGSGK